MKCTKKSFLLMFCGLSIYSNTDEFTVYSECSGLEVQIVGHKKFPRAHSDGRLPREDAVMSSVLPMQGSLTLGLFGEDVVRLIKEPDFRHDSFNGISLVNLRLGGATKVVVCYKENLRGQRLRVWQNKSGDIGHCLEGAEEPILPNAVPEDEGADEPAARHGTTVVPTCARKKPARSRTCTVL